jgi:hypothetical protein
MEPLIFGVVSGRKELFIAIRLYLAGCLNRIFFSETKSFAKERDSDDLIREICLSCGVSTEHLILESSEKKNLVQYLRYCGEIRSDTINWVIVITSWRNVRRYWISLKDSLPGWAWARTQFRLIFW